MNVVTIFTILGGLSGFAALVVALFAKRDSRKSNEIAHGSKDLAAESNRVAMDARDLAKEANEISLRTEQRDTESNLVTWTYSWPEPGVCKVTNIGEDDARDVLVTVTVDEESESMRCELVPKGKSISLGLAGLRNELGRAREEFEDRKRRYDARNSVRYTDIELPPQEFPVTADVAVTVVWKTPLGRERRKEFEDLTPFYP